MRGHGRNTFRRNRAISLDGGGVMVPLVSPITAFTTVPAPSGGNVGVASGATLTLNITTTPAGAGGLYIFMLNDIPRFETTDKSFTVTGFNPTHQGAYKVAWRNSIVDAPQIFGTTIIATIAP